MTALNKQALREAAIHAQSTDDWGCDDNNFHDQATPDVVLALLDELESVGRTLAVSHEAACSLVDENDELKRKLEAAENRRAEDAESLAEAESQEVVDSVAANAISWMKRFQAAENRIAELQSSVIAPGIMRCTGCGFVLTKNNINMAAGTITAGDSNTEPCPNGCGPLWPVTWKEQALQMRDSSEQWFEELQQSRQRIAELEAKLANPVLLPKTNGYWNEQEKAYEEAITLARRQIRLAGFRCEGDE